MAYARPGRGGLDYDRCSYGGSQLVFRGPARSLEGKYCAAIGGTETFGKFVQHPFPALLERMSGLRVVNFGCVNAGPDAFLTDPVLLAALRRSRAVVVQICGAQNLSNPFYQVHPRRNDRFVAPSPALRRLYPEVDFTEFAFTRHLLHGLFRAGPKRFSRLRATLQAVWIERMTALLGALPGPRVALWLAPVRVPEAAGRPDDPGPLFVTRAMVGALGVQARLVEVVWPRVAGGGAGEGMSFDPMERAAAAELPAPAAHEMAAKALEKALAGLLPA